MTPRVGEGEGVRVGEGDRGGEVVTEIVGLEPVDTVTDWVPAVVPFAQTTMTVYVPELTPDQEALWLPALLVSGTWRPWAKLAWPLESSEASPPVGHAVVFTWTVDPLEVTVICVFTAAAGPAVRASGSAAVAATVRPARTNI
ncbi:hypothetical protein GCM10023080_037580 [Streptomyces pseudoechinosporeus]